MNMKKKFIYLAQHPRESLIKIGCSIAPFKRTFVQKIQIIGILKDHNWLGQSYERELHYRFKHQQVKTEWFRDCDELRHFIFHSGAHENLWTGMGNGK